MTTRRWYYPCENDGVTCIGGIAHDARGKAQNSNYGADEVRMYAPYHVFVGADPAHPREDAARWSAGTSFSSPFVAGVAALVWATNPGMSADQVWDHITSTAHAGNDGVVPQYRRGDQPGGWQLPAEMRLRCRAMELEFQLTVTDPNGKTDTRSKRITIDFGPC